MHPKLIELVMQQEAELYNNIVDVEGCVGRLLVKLKIYPAPVITWDYEALGEDACRPDSDPISFRGTGFTIGEAHTTQRSYVHLPTEPRKAAMKGVTTRATYGAPDEQFHSFQFYLPNATFHEVNLVGQGQIEELIRASADGDSWDVGHGTAGRFITVELEHGWKIHLETKKLALDWLGSQDSIGTLITTVGRLYYPRDESNAESNTPTMSMNEALEHLDLLSGLLSFANGGYLGPLYVESMRWDGDDFSVAAVALANRTTPIQLIGPSWLTRDSDLRAFLECLPTLRRMLAVSPWDEVFPLMLT
jgi:hypothetical protein